MRQRCTASRAATDASEASSAARRPTSSSTAAASLASSARTAVARCATSSSASRCAASASASFSTRRASRRATAASRAVSKPSRMPPGSKGECTRSDVSPGRWAGGGDSGAVEVGAVLYHGCCVCVVAYGSFEGGDCAWIGRLGDDADAVRSSRCAAVCSVRSALKSAGGALRGGGDQASLVAAGRSGSGAGRRRCRGRA